MNTGTAPTKQAEPDRRERMEILDCGQLGIYSMAEFDALVDQYLAETPRESPNKQRPRQG